MTRAAGLEFVVFDSYVDVADLCPIETSRAKKRFVGVTEECECRITIIGADVSGQDIQLQPSALSACPSNATPEPEDQRPRISYHDQRRSTAFFWI